MFFLDKYFKGKGLNLTDFNLTKYPSTSNYLVSVRPKYSFILSDFEKLTHKEIDLLNFSRLLINNGFLIIRKSKKYINCYNEIYYYRELLSKHSLFLISFEEDENVQYFVFKKQKLKQTVYLGVVTNSKVKTSLSLNYLHTKDFLKNNFVSCNIYADVELWTDAIFKASLPGFGGLGIFIKHTENGFENNNVLYNFNRQINICKAKSIILINDYFKNEEFSLKEKYKKGYLIITELKKARQIGGIDFRYKTIEWGIYDFAIRMGDKISEPEYNEYDKNRFESKKQKGVIDGTIKWLNIHEALGDNICAFKLLNSLKNDCDLRVSTAYPFLYELSGELKMRYDIEELNGLGFAMYEHGSEINAKTMEYAYFSMFGEEERYNKRQNKYFYNPNTVENLLSQYKDKKIILIAPSASNREGPDNGVNKSNKTWDFDRWKKVVSYLKEKEYYVIQVGTRDDLKVDNVNEFFFNRSFDELVGLVKISMFFISLDTFFQHLCGIMNKKGIVLTPDHNDHALWPSAINITGKVKENFEHLRWIKDHLNPYRKPCMDNISVETVLKETDKLIDCFNKY